MIIQRDGTAELWLGMTRQNNAPEWQRHERDSAKEKA